MLIAQPRIIAADVPPEWLAAGTHRLDPQGEVEKRCRRCLCWFPAVEGAFYRERRSIDGLERTCAACRRDRTKELADELRRQGLGGAPRKHWINGAFWPQRVP